MREIEVHKEEINKMQHNFGLDSVLFDIEQKYKEKDMEAVIGLSSKCVFLFRLMKDLKENGHRLLIFSMSKKMLSLIQEIMNSCE